MVIVVINDYDGYNQQSTGFQMQQRSATTGWAVVFLCFLGHK